MKLLKLLKLSMDIWNFQKFQYFQYFLKIHNFQFFDPANFQCKRLDCAKNLWRDSGDIGAIELLGHA